MTDQKASVREGRLPREFATNPLNYLRCSALAPYRKGSGLPSFYLRMYDAGTRWDGFRSRDYVSFELCVRGAVTIPSRPSIPEVKSFEWFTFEGWIGLPPGVAIDSDEALRECWQAAAMKPGDTDSEFFESYPARLLEIVREHGEAIAYEAMNRFGEG